MLKVLTVAMVASSIFLMGCQTSVKDIETICYSNANAVALAFEAPERTQSIINGYGTRYAHYNGDKIALMQKGIDYSKYKTTTPEKVFNREYRVCVQGYNQQNASSRAAGRALHHFGESL